MRHVLYACLLVVVSDSYAQGRLPLATGIVKSKLEGLGISGEALNRGINAFMALKLVKTYRRSYPHRGNLTAHTLFKTGEYYHKNGEFFHDLLTTVDVSKWVSHYSVQKGDRGHVLFRTRHLLLEYEFRFWGDTVKVTKLPATDLKSGNEVVVSNRNNYPPMGEGEIYGRDRSSDDKRSYLFERWMQANMVGIAELTRYANNGTTYRAIINSRLDELGMTKRDLHSHFGSNIYDLTQSPPRPTYRDDLAALSETLALDPELLEEVVAIEYFLRRYAHITRRPYDNTGRTPLSHLPVEWTEALQSALAVMQAVNMDDTSEVEMDTLQTGGEKRFTTVHPVPQYLKDHWHKLENK